MSGIRPRWNAKDAGAGQAIDSSSGTLQVQKLQGLSLMARQPDPQPVNLSGMDKPALHPDRIRTALVFLRDNSFEIDRLSDALRVKFEAYESAITALELIRKSQLAVGLTGQVVDAGRSAMDLLDALKRIGK